MSVRTYNPSVRVGNWNEDIQLEEDLLKDFMERREKGQLQIQKSSNLGLMTSNISLSISRDGYVHFGDMITIKCPAAVNRIAVNAEELPRDECVVAINMPASQLYEDTKLEGPCGVSGTKNTEACSRTAFVIASIDGSPDGHPLRFGQPFNLKTSSSDGFYLHSDRASFQKSAKKSRHQEVTLVRCPSFLTQWQILSFDPRLRMEFEGSPVPANERIVFNHVRTNQNLAVEEKQTVRTPFGVEYELSAHTFRDSHKAEMDVNHWKITTGSPGDEIYPSTEQK